MGSETSKKMPLTNEDDVPKTKRFSLPRSISQGWLLIIFLENLNKLFHF